MNNQVRVPPMMFREKVFNQYNNVYLAIIRELAQNSFDAKATALRIKVEKNSFLAEDDGVGMDREKAESVFLSLMGSDKKGDESKTGAFGAAKEVLAYAWQNWSIAGQGFQAYGSGINYDFLPLAPGVKRGFMIGATDESLSEDDLKLWAERISARSYLPGMSIYLNGERMISGRYLSEEMVIKRWDWGTLYLVKGPLKNTEQRGTVYIRTRGLYTSYFQVDLPHQFYLEITGKSTEILTENRDELRWNPYRSNAITECQKLIKDQSRLVKRPRPVVKLFNFDYGKMISQLMTFVQQANQAASGQTVVANRVVMAVQGDAPEKDRTIIGSSGRETRVEDMSHQQFKEYTGPFAILTDGENRSEKEAYERGKLKPHVVKALNLLHIAMMDVASQAKVCEGMYLVPAILLLGDDVDYTGIHQEVYDNVHLIGCKLEDLINGSIFSVVGTIIHELAHCYYSHHGDDFVGTQAHIKAEYGDRFFDIAVTMKALRMLP